MVRNYLMRARYFHRVIKARYRNQHSELNVILSNLHQGDVALDIGANKGAYLYWMRKAVGIDGKVYAYEPQPALASYLKLLCTAMKWNNVFVHNCALSDRTGGGTLYIPGDSDSPSASLDPAVLKSQTGHHYECRIDTLDHQMEHVGRIALLKIDVEGHELQVFRGGAAILSRDRPVLLFECEARHLQNHTQQDVFVFLENLGYKGTFFSPQGLKPLNDFLPEIHQKRGTGGLLAPDYCSNFLFKAQD